MSSLFRWEDHPYGSFGYVEGDPVNPRIEIQRDYRGDHRIHIGVHSMSSYGEKAFFMWILIHDGIFRHQEDAKARASSLVAQWLWQNVANAA